MEREIVDIYTDGSAEKAGTKRLGCGSYCHYNDEDYSMSISCTREVLSKYGIPLSQPCSNPTSEFVAFVETLRILKCTSKNFHLKFWIDYNGVGKWTSGEWKAKEPHIKLILEEYNKIKKTMKCEVSIHWVKGHSGEHGNVMADALAGSYTTDTEEFEVLAELLQ
jgi:ribonuclease HI